MLERLSVFKIGVGRFSPFLSCIGTNEIYVKCWLYLTRISCPTLHKKVKWYFECLTINLNILLHENDTALGNRLVVSTPTHGFWKLCISAYAKFCTYTREKGVYSYTFEMLLWQIWWRKFTGESMCTYMYVTGCGTMVGLCSHATNHGNILVPIYGCSMYYSWEAW